MLDPQTLVSIVIPNYNYAAFVGQAIESALAIDWPQVEVIVVDDGSTDGSRHVIESFGARVVTVFQANAGQTAACVAGFERSSGELVFFLDSDDLLAPNVVKALAPHWTAAVSKVQFQMKTIDAAGVPMGSVLPQFLSKPTARQARDWMLRSGAYPTPPGSANAYARWFVSRVLASPDLLDRAADSALLAAAPLLGDVVTVAEPLVSYRIHGGNQGVMKAFDAARPGREMARAQLRFRFAQRLAAHEGLDLPNRAFGRGLSMGLYRAASLRLSPATHPLAGDRRGRVIADALRGLFVGQGLSLTARLALAGLIVAVCVLPASTGRTLVEWRLVPTSRPPFLRRGLQFARVIR